MASRLATRDLTASALESVLVDFVERGLPDRRLSKLAGLLLLSSDLDRRPAWGDSLVERLLAKRHDDGGWVDCEDTTWSAFVLQKLGERFPAGLATEWIRSERSGRGWGYCRRDEPSIPTTALVACLLPALADEHALNWLREAWNRDLASPVHLSYKGAWYLLGDSAGISPAADALRARTVTFLLNDQRPDGGWGPWRDHPAATDCFSTGLALWALAQEPLTDRIAVALTRGARWCDDHCRSDGLYPTHFIEEGSGWILVGQSFALNSLASD